MNNILHETNHHQLWKNKLSDLEGRLANSKSVIVEGRLSRMVGLTLEAVGCQAAIGSRCLLENQQGEPVEAEVVGFSGKSLFLMPTGNIRGIRPGSRVTPTQRMYEVAISDDVLGRVLDGSGKPLDGKGTLKANSRQPLMSKPINPLDREPINKPLDVGVKAINALLTVGRGQRMGLFAGSGVGKSVLLGMMTRFTEADVIVVGLIGERGREVKDFIDNILGEKGMKRSVVVAVPADQSPVMRMHGAYLATSIAEYFRDQGKHVLLLMDSLTRFAQAQREVALAIGEPPVTKGYPPSVFALLPQLVERVGNGLHGNGSITAFYTVLTEGDDQQDPIADASRAILDGHIVLSRELAEQGHYPAIDVEASISRIMTELVSQQHLEMAHRFKQVYSLYQKNRDLINIGAYISGSDENIDQAISMQPAMKNFLMQSVNQSGTWQESQQKLAQVLSTIPDTQETEQSISVM